MFLPELPHPEHSNAHNTMLWEITLLKVLWLKWFVVNIENVWEIKTFWLILNFLQTICSISKLNRVLFANKLEGIFFKAGSGAQLVIHLLFVFLSQHDLWETLFASAITTLWFSSLLLTWEGWPHPQAKDSCQWTYFAGETGAPF